MPAFTLLALLLAPPARAGGPATHHEATYAICALSGLAELDCDEIAWMDQMTDAHESMQPMPAFKDFISPEEGPWRRSGYHAFSPAAHFGVFERRVLGSPFDTERADALTQQASANLWREIQAERNPDVRTAKLGLYLHRVQDVSFHQGFGPSFGQIADLALREGWTGRRTWWDLVGRLEDAKDATYASMEDADSIVLNRDRALDSMKRTRDKLYAYALDNRWSVGRRLTDEDLTLWLDHALVGALREAKKRHPEDLSFQDIELMDRTIYRNNPFLDKFMLERFGRENPVKKLPVFDPEKPPMPAIRVGRSGQRPALKIHGRDIIIDYFGPEYESAARRAGAARYEAVPGGLRAFSQDPGGIDLSNIRLERVERSGDLTRLSYRVSPAGPRFPHQGDQLALAREAYALRCRGDREGWRVNLMPNSVERSRIVGDAIALSRVGEALLRADLELKRDTVPLFVQGGPLNRAMGARVAGCSPPFQLGAKFLAVPGLTQYALEDGQAVLGQPALAVDYKGIHPSELEAREMSGSPCEDPYSVHELVRARTVPVLERRLNGDPRYAPVRNIYAAAALADASGCAARLPDGAVPPPIGDGYVRELQEAYVRDVAAAAGATGGVNLTGTLAVQTAGPIASRGRLFVEVYYTPSATPGNAAAFEALRGAMARTAAYDEAMHPTYGRRLRRLGALLWRRLGPWRLHSGGETASGSAPFRLFAIPLALLLAGTAVQRAWRRHRRNPAFWLACGGAALLFWRLGPELLHLLSLACWLGGVWLVLLYAIRVYGETMDGEGLAAAGVALWVALWAWFGSPDWDWFTVFMPLLFGHAAAIHALLEWNKTGRLPRL